MDYRRHIKRLDALLPHLLRAVPGACWLLLAVAPPLLINLWGQQPFELPKVAVVRTLVWALAGLAVAAALLQRRSPGVRPATNPLLWPVLLLALIIAVTTATAVDPRLSLWGSYERAQGAVTLLTYLLLCLLAAGQLTALSRARSVLAALVAAAIPIILLSLFQAAGWNPLGLVSDARSPVYATLGRSNFVGGFLSLIAAPALALALTTRRRNRRLLWAAVLVAGIVVAGLTLARGAWLALTVSLVLFGLLWWGPRLGRHWRLAGWSIVGLLVVAGPAAVLWLGRTAGGSIAARLAIWRAIWTLVKERPLLGYGADGLGQVFPGVFPPELVYYQGRDFFVDRAHNLVLDWTAVAGLPGLLALALVLATWVIVVAQALRRPHTPQRRAMLIATLAAVAGNLTHTLVSFDVTATATAFWLLIGLGIALATPAGPFAELQATWPSLWRRAAAVSVVTLVALASIMVNARPVLADIAARTAERHATIGDWQAAVTAAQRAATLWPPEPAHHQRLSRSNWQYALANPAVAPVTLPVAESALQAARQLRPGDPGAWLQSAQFYMSAARHFGRDTRLLADDAYRRALALAPNHATIYAAWGRDYLADGNPAAAAPLLRRAVDLDATHHQAVLDLAAAERLLGRVELSSISLFTLVEAPGGSP